MRLATTLEFPTAIGSASPSSVVQDAIVWLNDPANWTGPNGIVALTAEHLTMSLVAVLAAATIALPLGIWLGHTGRGATLTSPAEFQGWLEGLLAMSSDMTIVDQDYIAAGD